MNAAVTSVHLSSTHSFSKQPVDALTLVAGIGAIGDAHAGSMVKHRSRVAADPTQPNLRQVHLLHGELLDELAARGFAVNPGELGENIATTGVDLVNLPTGTTVCIGDDAIVSLTGLRNPCRQIEAFQTGLQSQVLGRNNDGSLARLAGVMAVVIRGGAVSPGDPIRWTLPPEPHHRLETV